MQIRYQALAGCSRLSLGSEASCWTVCLVRPTLQPGFLTMQMAVLGERLAMLMIAFICLTNHWRRDG